MAEALLPFAVKGLWNLLVRETERFQGVEEEFEGLKDDVDMLRCFLKDAEAKKHVSEMVRKTIKDIKEIVFDAEDIVETFLLKKELGESSRNIMKRSSAYVAIKRRGLGFDVKTISKRISEVIHDMQNLGVQKVIINEEHMQALEVREREMQQTFSRDEEDHLVGLERNVQILVGYLLDEDSSPVVSITGMGGIGKTTLARKVFNHETIKTHFPRLVWVCVSQQFTRNCIWQTILRQLRAECDVPKMKEDELHESIVQVLETQKALIIIDDIWREEDWDLIKHVLMSKKGLKVLITSRNEEVALHADKHCVTIKPQCLTFEESWDVFQRIAFPIKDTAEFKIDEDMKEIGKEMIKNCGGLPIALKVLGGLLAKKYTLHQWKMIHENIKAHIVRGTGFDDRNVNREVYDVLNLSFEELPAYLKNCFLYLASFPEDYEIDVEILSYYWAAEGMLYFNGGSIREVADGYIEELVKGNMVISKRDAKTFRFETCQLHDMMREVSLRQAKEENFVQTIDTSTANSKSPCQYRRLAVVHSSGGEKFNLDTEVKNPSLRSLLHINDGKLKATHLFFTRHELMRVLDLSWVKFNGGKVPSSIEKLIHLRYLSLKKSNVIELPSSMRNLKKLLYLNLNVHWRGFVYVPNVLKEMQDLAFLWLPESLHDETMLELGNLVNLETLKNFSTKHGRVTDLQAMTRLRSLSIFIRNKRYTMEDLSSSLSKLSHLESLSIDNKSFYTPVNDDEEGFVWNFVNLRQLKLEIYMPRLPDAQHFPPNLTTIYLALCCLKDDPMPILEKLLHLKEISFVDRSFCGRRMVCSRDGFPQLQKLKFNGLKEWEEWIVEEGSMPLLHSIKIESCPRLKELPDGLRFITNLKELGVVFSGDKFNLRFLEGYLPFHLTTISLEYCHLKEDPMPILEKFIHLKEVSLYYQSFCGRRMVCSKDGFPQLKKLIFVRLDEWEEWIVEEGSLPLLHTLNIHDCKGLKELPDGLRFITSLKSLTCFRMGKRWRKRLSEGGKDYYKVQHIPSVKFFD